MGKIIKFVTGSFTHKTTHVRVEATGTNPVYAYRRATGVWERNGNLWAMRRKRRAA